MPSEPERYEPLPSLLELPSYLFRKIPPRRRRLVAIGGPLLLAVIIAATAAFAIAGRSSEREREAREARTAAAAKAALKARYAREARPIRGEGAAASGRGGAAALSARRALVGDLQSAVLADAKARAERGELKGSYRDSICYRYPKGVHDLPPAEDLAHATLVVECLAVTRQIAPDERTTTGSLIGQPYRARIDFAHGRYAFCKIVQRPGELSIQRENILKVPAACGGSR